jgi:hypothetical protein
VVDPSTGCSVEEACPCENAWENHGAYVCCVADATNTLVGMGLITGAEKGAIMAEAGASSCGKMLLAKREKTRGFRSAVARRILPGHAPARCPMDRH